MKTNQMAELEQKIPTSLNPASQMSYFQLNVGCKTMKFQIVHCDAYVITVSHI